MKDWIMELCPEIAEWQAELIAEHADLLVASEREACAKVCDLISDDYDGTPAGTGADNCATAIRARGQE